MNNSINYASFIDLDEFVSSTEAPVNETEVTVVHTAHQTRQRSASSGHDIRSSLLETASPESLTEATS